MKKKASKKVMTKSIDFCPFSFFYRILDLSRLGCRVHFEIDDNSTNENDRKNYDSRNRKK
jgi:hypothetical protein